MSENSNISSLFDPSGNLTFTAMEHFLRDELSQTERALVEKHLAESEFDREALEGLQKLASNDLRNDVDDLQKNILVLAGQKKVTNNFRFSARPYWISAAGLAGLIGLSVLFFFMFRGPIDKPQLAVMQPDTIFHEDVPITEQLRKNPIQLKEEIPEQKIQSEISLPIKTVPEKVTGITEGTRETLEPMIPQEPDALSQQIAVVENNIEVDDDLSIEYQIVGGIAITDDNNYTEGKHVRKESKSSTQNIVKSDYEMDEFVSSASEHQSEDQIFMVVESMPEFPGGDKALYKFLADSIQYPTLARESNIQGKVYVTFTIEKDGTITEVRVLRGIGGGCDEAALRVIKSMPKWIPGKQRGKPVRVQYNLPVKFSLE